MHPHKVRHTLVIVAALTVAAYGLAYTVDALITRALPVPPESPGQTAPDPARGSSVQAQGDKPLPGKGGGTAAGRGVDRTRRAPGSPPPPGRPAVEQVSEGRWLVDRNALLASSSDLNRLLKQARAVPFKRQGKPAGVRLVRIQAGSLYEKMGLRGGDLITRVNSQKLDEPAKFFRMYQELKHRKTISLDLERNGRQLTLTYETR